jgi:nitrate/TMAO reductase-like tetraheme cytochrome c subunit
MSRFAMPRPASAGRGIVVWCSLLLVALAGCGDGGGGEKVPLPPADERQFRTIEAFEAGYWNRPIPHQGASASANDSLHPASCGSCHALQYQDWQTALHSKAYSPGLEGQLVWWEESDYASVEQCQVCHAPLTEQQAQIVDYQAGTTTPNGSYDPTLQRQGIVCAACHMRGGQGHGPPVRGGATPPPAEGAAHGGSIRSEFFERSDFCAGCHQFAEPAINGKSLQNTNVEWAASRYPAEGKICQTCHMPDRRHLWRGIHDSTMTRNGVTIAFERSGRNQLVLRVTNTATGHQFPTYVTPKVVVVVEQLDAAGSPLPDGRTEGTIGRSVEGTATGWIELYDTRIAPDSSFQLQATIAPGAVSARAVITVHPDGFYDGMFASLLSGNLSDTSRVLIAEAKRRTAASPYRIYAETLPIR